MTRCRVLKSFPFSANGINIEHAGAGSIVLLPEHLVKGLEKAGYVTVVTVEIQNVVAPETKIIEAAPETKPAWLK